jgi:hypothetical protein
VHGTGRMGTGAPRGPTPQPSDQLMCEARRGLGSARGALSPCVGTVGVRSAWAIQRGRWVKEWAGSGGCTIGAPACVHGSVPGWPRQRRLRAPPAAGAGPPAGPGTARRGARGGQYFPVEVSHADRRKVKAMRWGGVGWGDGGEGFQHGARPAPKGPATGVHQCRVGKTISVPPLARTGGTGVPARAACPEVHSGVKGLAGRAGARAGSGTAAAAREQGATANASCNQQQARVLRGCCVFARAHAQLRVSAAR